MKKRISPYLLILFSFLAIIIIGMLLLKLPFAVKEGEHLSWIDAFYMSSSMVTVTGSSTVANIGDTFSVFGKIIITILVQVGGLSVITISVFIMLLLGAKIGITNRILLKENLNQTNAGGIVKLVRRIVITALVIEALGFIINLIIFLPQYPLFEAVGISLFHAIASFNGSGIDIFNNQILNFSDGHWLLNISTALMSIFGGLGIIVLHDLYEKKSFKKLTNHSKIVLKMELIIFVLGLFLFKLTEMNNNNFSWGEAGFLSIMSRSAGFNFINFNLLSATTILIMIILMFIGTAPSSTGGGVKITTIYVLYKTVRSYATGKKAVIGNKIISEESKHKAFVLFAAYTVIIVFATFVLMIAERYSLQSAIFEATASLSNVGITLESTASLSIFSKIFLPLIMVLGRIGPLTVLSMFNTKWYLPDSELVGYIEEKIIIG